MLNEFLSIAEGWSTGAMIIRMVCALFTGTIIGIDRAIKRRGAGIKTHTLVCLGAALVMMTGQYIKMNFEGNMDIARMGAQVISGVGFLGVGTIIVTGKNQIRGLTTAAGLWACACLGLAIGAGFYEGVLLGFFAIFLSIKVLPYIEDSILAYSRNINLYVELVSMERMRDFIALLHERNIQIYDMELDRQRGRRREDRGGVIFYLRPPRSQSHPKLMTELSCSPDVHTIDEI